MEGTQVVVPATPAPIAAPAPAASIEAGIANAQAQPGVTDASPITLTVNGQSVTKPLSEWKSGWMMHADYTRKTQEVSAARQELTQREQMVREFLQDPQQVEAYLGMLKAQSQPQVPVNPEAPVTMQQLARLAQLQEQRTAQMFEGFQQRLATESTTGTIKAAAAQALEQALQAAPGLRNIPKVDILLKQIAADSQPATIEDMRAAIIAAAQKVAGTLNQQVQQQTQAQQLQQQQLVSRGTEPPGGGGVLPQPTSYFNPQTRQVDWRKVDTDATAWMNARLRGGA